MNEYDWSQFVVRIPVNASIEDLYKAWATRKGIEHCFLRMSVYRHNDGSVCKDDELVSLGDTYAWRWHGWPDEMEEYGTILDCTVTIKKEGNLSMVELVQSEIPSDEHGCQFWHIGCKTGWTFYFTNMKSIFEGGIDLRNKDERIKNVINA